jgi:hypothetical protein
MMSVKLQGVVVSSSLSGLVLSICIVRLYVLFSTDIHDIVASCCSILIDPSTGMLS